MFDFVHLWNEIADHGDTIKNVLGIVATSVFAIITYFITDIIKSRKNNKPKFVTAMDDIYHPIILELYEVNDLLSISMEQIKSNVVLIDRLFVNNLDYVPSIHINDIKRLKYLIARLEDTNYNEKIRMLMDKRIRKEFKRTAKHIYNYYNYIKRNLGYPYMGLFQDYISICSKPRFFFYYTIVLICLLFIPYITYLYSGANFDAVIWIVLLLIICLIVISISQMHTYLLRKGGLRIVMQIKWTCFIQKRMRRKQQK